MSADSLPRSFFDTNVLIYADDGASPDKQRKALDLIKKHLRGRTGAVSIQILQEYFVAAEKKLSVDADLIRRKVEVYSRFHVAEPRVTDILAAIDFHRLHRLSFWDALVLRMAKQAACTVLLTEDLNHGQIIDGLRIVNPFL
ncbi:PIN domain-containing protein [Acidobacteria bacterium AB60]|nr:PIN domain-containing protein [Acidobacteria bacterium AB60]